MGIKPSRRTLSIIVAGVVLVAGAKKPYENVNREIMIEPYWEDAQPASNLLPGARRHERKATEKFEGLGYTRFKADELSAALLAADMKLLQLLDAHRTFELDGATVEIDLDRFRRYVMGARSNPDIEEVLVFRAGFLLFPTVTEEGWSDLMMPVDPASVEELVTILKAR